MSRTEERDALARKAAETLWSKKKQATSDVVKQKELARQSDAEATARLRALRLAAEKERPERSKRAAPKR